MESAPSREIAFTKRLQTWSGSYIVWCREHGEIPTVSGFNLYLEHYLPKEYEV